MSSTDFKDCESCACFSARKTARLLTQHFERYLRPSGLKATQYTLLVALIRLGRPTSPNRLADLLGLERTTLTRNLQTLELQGYTDIKTGEDKRTRLIEITPQGVAAIEKAYPFWQKAQALVAEHLSPATLKSQAMTASRIR